MKLRMPTFGEIEVEGERYDYDLVIEQGEIRKRGKKPSTAYRAHYGHTPLSAEEAIPWHGKTLFVGTGMYGKLPIMPELQAEAEARAIESVSGDMTASKGLHRQTSMSRRCRGRDR